ncbi:hypothetical protein WM08_17215 [Burkholderia ubonensis]|uniref:PD-(D/E)XK nuclease domain-containing protein n=1 Tax=Burkholderia ubonensis TaxID=101571 RepID=UPI00075F74AD|nr:hypothetical protein [Burkholderia ubonensis]KWI87175.1 hypothetical protein WM08_17215 [Burkholderia ubonensis]
MKLEDHLLILSVNRAIEAARLAVTDIVSVQESFSSQKDVDVPNRELDDHKANLEYCIEKIFRESSMLAERLQMPLLAKKIAGARSSFEDLDFVGCRESGDFEVEHFSPALQAAVAHFRSIEEMVDATDLGGMQVFRTILENSAKIIEDAEVEPTKEADVQNAIFTVLRYAFRDAQREVKLQKILKEYRMDFGIPSLKAAAEYKFVDSPQKARSCLDGIYTDMKGYGGTHDWQSFFAVVYMTGPFLHQKDVDLEFKLVGADFNWTPIVVVGPGRRTAKASAV